MGVWGSCWEGERGGKGALKGGGPSGYSGVNVGGWHPDIGTIFVPMPWHPELVEGLFGGGCRRLKSGGGQFRLCSNGLFFLAFTTFS